MPFWTIFPPSVPGQAVVFYLMVGFFILAAAFMAVLAVETKDKSLESLVEITEDGAAV